MGRWGAVREPREAPAPVRIEQRRISRLGAHLLGVPRGGLVAPVVRDPARHARRLGEVGFPPDLEEGQVLLPAIVGRRSRFNADGDERPQRERPKERVATLGSVPRGSSDADERSVHIWSHARYPRTRVPGPNVELRVARGGHGDLVIATETFLRGDDDQRLAHTINLLLEIFGECVLQWESPVPVGAAAAPEKRLNWELAPADPYGRPLAAPFTSVVADLPPPVRAVARYRLQRIMELEPDVIAVGRAGYRGCGAFGFSAHRHYVTESLYHDNATHVSARGWDELSRRPKSDLLAGLPGDQPIEHSRGWETRLRNAVEA